MIWSKFVIGATNSLVFDNLERLTFGNAQGFISFDTLER